MRIFQKGFNYSQDGQGNRLVYHLQGCNMKCPWCSNPEGMSTDGVLMVEKQWLLPSVCPHGAIKEHTLDREYCLRCIHKECITKHRSKGIRRSYKEFTVAEIVEEATENRSMYYDGGGVTFSGGEAMLQYEDVMESLKGLHERGIHTAIETNGTHPRLEEIFPYVDQLILDCKICDPKKHIEQTGMGNKTIIANLKIAAHNHPCVHVRVPMIGGVNNSEKDIEDFLTLFESMQSKHVTFELLAYHEYGKTKWEQCGECYTMTEKAYIKESDMKNFQNQIIKKGLQYKKT